MTISDAKAKLVSWANSQVGYKESANNWNKYAENEDLRQLYGWKPQCQPWCDSFVDAGMCLCFGLELASKLTYQPIGKGSAACRYSAGFYSAHEAFFQSPEVGDQVFFYVDNGINHTGIVVGISGKTVTTVEGNSGDMVRRNSYTLGSSVIAGYGRPDWNAVLTEEDKPVEESPVKAEIKVKGLPMLQKGDKGEVVRAAQILLIGRKCSCGIWGADADFGNGTMAAVKAFQHRTNEAARQTVLVEDGIIGDMTWNYLLGVM